MAEKGGSDYNRATWRQGGSGQQNDANADAEWQTGSEYARWGARMAGCLAIGNGLEPGRDVRCTVRVARHGPLHKTRKGKARPEKVLPASSIGFAWAGAEACLRTILHFYGSNRGVAQNDAAAKWLQARIAGKLDELWIPKRVQEWVPGKKPKRRKAQQPDDEAKESSSDEGIGDSQGYTTWREVKPSVKELAKWRLIIKHPKAADQADWTTMMVEAARMAAVAKRKAKAQARRDAVTWAKECLEGSATKAHGFVKPKGKVLDLMDLPEEKDANGDLRRVTCPNAAVKRIGGTWHSLWARDRALREALMDRIQKLREACRKDDEADEIDLHQVKAGIKKLNAKAVSGLDVVTARELAALPDEALIELAGILNRVNKAVAWPRQCLHHQIVLLAKPRGGQRPICLVAMVIKLWEAIHSETILSWEEARVGFWDDAVRGSSALRAAALRRLIAEVAGEHQEAFLFILWDAEKFYDNVDLGILLEAALRLGLPCREMVLCVDVLLAPREIRIGKVVGAAEAASNGLLAGMRRANFMARLLLFSTIETIHKAVPRAGPRSYVDDLTQLVTGERGDVAETASRGAWLLMLALRQLKVVVSAKTVIVGSDIGLARTVADWLVQKSGTALECATSAVDLGIDCGGSRRCMVKTTEREEKANAKLARIGYLGSLHRTADKLVKSGADPQRAFGHEVYGTAPARLASWRTRNGRALHFAKSCCMASAYALCDAITDPAVTARLNQVKLWCGLWQRTCADIKAPVMKIRSNTIGNQVSGARWFVPSDEAAEPKHPRGNEVGTAEVNVCERVKVQTAEALVAAGQGDHDAAENRRKTQATYGVELVWQLTPTQEAVSLKPRVQLAWHKFRDRTRTERWRGVSGPLGATISTLEEIGWEPLEPDVWCDDHGARWTIRDDGIRNRLLERAVEKSVMAGLWRKAALHYCGGGLEGGGDLTAAKKMRARLIRNEKWQELGILDNVVQGGAWFGDRFSMADNKVTGTCARCGELETPEHAIYDCPDNAKAGKGIARTQFWAKQAGLARKSAGYQPCLWTRGIVPIQLVTAPLDGEGPWRHRWVFGDVRLFDMAATNPRVRIGSDGAGGKNGSDPRIARVAWASVAVLFATDDEDCTDIVQVAGYCGGLRGRQTVPRAEAAGLLNAASAARRAQGTVTVGIDNSGVIDQLRGEREDALASEAGDIWATFHAGASTWQGNTVGLKVKSHATAEDFDAGLRGAWAVTNEVADLHATWAADQLQVSAQVEEQVKWYDRIARAVLRRNVAVISRGIELEELKGSRKPLAAAGTKESAVKSRKAATKIKWLTSRHTLPLYDPKLGKAVKGGVRCGACLRGPESSTRAGIEAFLSGGCAAKGDVDIDNGTDATTDESMTSSSEDEAQAKSNAERQACYDWEMGGAGPTTTEEWKRLVRPRRGAPPQQEANQRSPCPTAEPDNCEDKQPQCKAEASEVTSVQRLRTALNRLDAVTAGDAKRQKREELARTAEGFDSDDEVTWCIRKEIWCKQLDAARTKVQAAEAEIDAQLPGAESGVPDAGTAETCQKTFHYAADDDMENELARANVVTIEGLAEAAAARLEELIELETKRASGVALCYNIGEDADEDKKVKRSRRRIAVARREATEAADLVKQTNEFNLEGELEALLEMDAAMTPTPQGLGNPKAVESCRIEKQSAMAVALAGLIHCTPAGRYFSGAGCGILAELTEAELDSFGFGICGTTASIGVEADSNLHDTATEGVNEGGKRPLQGGSGCAGEIFAADAEMDDWIEAMRAEEVCEAPVPAQLARALTQPQGAVKNGGGVGNLGVEEVCEALGPAQLAMALTQPQRSGENMGDCVDHWHQVVDPAKVNSPLEEAAEERGAPSWLATSEAREAVPAGGGWQACDQATPEGSAEGTAEAASRPAEFALPAEVGGHWRKAEEEVAPALAAEEGGALEGGCWRKEATADWEDAEEETAAAHAAVEGGALEGGLWKEEATANGEDLRKAEEGAQEDSKPAVQTGASQEGRQGGESCSLQKEEAIEEVCEAASTATDAASIERTSKKVGEEACEAASAATDAASTTTAQVRHRSSENFDLTEEGILGKRARTATGADEEAKVPEVVGVRFKAKAQGCSLCGGPCGKDDCRAGRAANPEKADYSAAAAFEKALAKHREKAAGSHDAPKHLQEDAKGATESSSGEAATRKRAAESQRRGRPKKRRLVQAVSLNFGQLPTWLQTAPRLGNTPLHESHLLAWHRGLLWCWRCGCIASTIPHNLRMPCQAPTIAGERQLKRLKQGLTPLTMVDWPLDCEAANALSG